MEFTSCAVDQYGKSLEAVSPSKMTLLEELDIRLIQFSLSMLHVAGVDSVLLVRVAADEGA